MSTPNSTSSRTAAGFGGGKGRAGSSGAAAGPASGAGTVPAPRRGTTPPPGLWGALAGFDPGRWWLHPVVAALWVYVAGWLPIFARFSPLWLVPGAAVMALVLGLKARAAYPESIYGRDQRAQAVAVCVLGSVMAAAWWLVAGSGTAGPLDPLALVMWAGCTAVVLGGYAVTYKRAPHARAVQREQIAHDETKLFTSTWNRMLSDAGMPGARVVLRTWDDAPGGGRPTGYMLTVNGEGGTTGPVTARTAKQYMEKLTARASSVLARPPWSQQISPGALTVHETDTAHIWLLHVTTAPPLAEKITYQVHGSAAGGADGAPVELERLGSITEGIRVGRTTTGSAWTIALLRAHVKLVGATQSGKSTVLRRLVAALLEKPDVAVWMAGTDKLLPLAAPWLVPWLAGRTDRPVIDWVAGEDHQRVLECLAAAYQVMRLRNANMGLFSKVKPSPARPALVVIVDEAQACLPRPETIRTHDGQDMTASALFLALARAGASCGLITLSAGQSGLVEAQGKNGSDIERNQTIRACGKTQNAYDGSRTLPALPNIDTTRLRDHLWLYQGNVEEASSDKVKAELIEDDEVPGVAEAYSPRRPASVDAEHAGALGEAYRRRWDAERNPELAATCLAEGWSWPGTGNDAAQLKLGDRRTPPPAPRAAGPNGAGQSRRPDGRPLDTAEQQALAELAAQFTQQPGDQAGELTGGHHVPDQQPHEPTGTSGSGHAGGASFGDALTGALTDAVNAYKQAGDQGGPDDPTAGAAAAAAEAEARRWERVPEPLRTIARKLQHPAAPKGWVSTADLARQLDRITHDASEEEITKATTKLGQDLARCAPGLTGGRAPREVNAARPRGYEVSALLDAAGEFLDPGDPTAGGSGDRPTDRPGPSR